MADLQVRDLIPAFGAVVEGVDPTRPLDAGSARLLNETFDERGLLIFRGIDLDQEYQGYLASTMIGQEEPNDIPMRDIMVSNKEPNGYAPYGRLLFHSDMMWHERPFQVLSLYGVQVEPPAVPTVFASTKHAWDTLPDDLRARVDGLHVIHNTNQQRRGPVVNDEDLLVPTRAHEAMTTTPIAYPHPRTGQTLLYISQMNTSEIVELPHDESEELLELLFAHLYGPENTYAHDWRNGDLVAWDNQAIQHARGTVKTEGPARTLRKVIRPIPTLTGIETPTYTRAG